MHALMRAVTYVLSYASSDIRALTCVLRTGRSGRAVHLLYLAGDLTWTFTCYELAATLLSPRCELAMKLLLKIAVFFFGPQKSQIFG